MKGIMTTDEMRALPQWPKIKEVIDKTITAFQRDFPAAIIELEDRGTSLVIVVDSEDEIEIDASIIHKATHMMTEETVQGQGIRLSPSKPRQQKEGRHER